MDNPSVIIVPNKEKQDHKTPDPDSSRGLCLAHDVELFQEHLGCGPGRD
jgi:hypothetical protein